MGGERSVSTGPRRRESDDREDERRAQGRSTRQAEVGARREGVRAGSSKQQVGGQRQAREQARKAMKQCVKQIEIYSK